MRSTRPLIIAAVAHNDFSFNVKRSSNVATIGTLLVWGNAIVTPTFADYRFGDRMQFWRGTAKLGVKF